MWTIKVFIVSHIQENIQEPAMRKIWRWLITAGNTPLNKLYVCATLTHSVWFLSRFGMKMDVEVLITVWNRVWFSREPQERINEFFFLFKLQMNKEVQVQVLRNNSKCLNSTLTSLGQSNGFGSECSLQKPALKTAMKFRDQVRKRAWRMAYFGLE